MYEKREVRYLNLDNHEELGSAFLPDVVLLLKVEGQTRYFDLGTIFYTEYLPVSKKTHAASVIKSSFITNLSEPISEYFQDILQKFSHASLMHFLKVIRNVVHDLSIKDLEIKLSNKDEIFQSYETYTNYLIMTRSSKLKDSSADMGIYNRKQTVFAEILSRLLNIDLLSIKNSYVEIASKHKGHNQPVDDDIFGIFNELNKRIFITFSNFLMNEMKLPINLVFDELNINLALSISNKAKMIEFACTAFANCFASESAINPAQLYNLKINEIRNISASTKGMRVITIKPRAGYKTTELRLHINFKKVLNQYLKFREWIFINYTTKNKSNEEINTTQEKTKKDFDLMLLGLDNRKSTYGEKFIIPYSSGQHSAFKDWFELNFPTIDWIPLAQLRATIANITYNVSGSSLAVAQRLGNTTPVVATSYSEATENQTLTEMSNVFKEFTTAASIISKNPVAIKIDVENTQNTDMGHCLSRTPSLAKEYESTELETPECGNTISCLFCENFVLHTDEVDLRKLLSAKKIYELANSKENAENIFIVLQKINDILDYINDQFSEKRELIRRLEKEVNNGKLTNYFATTLNLLSDLGVDFT